MSTGIEPTAATIRNLTPGDLGAVIAIDALATGRRREEFYQIKLKQALADTGIAVSLGAEVDGHLVGFLLARVYYGEFGVLERVAVLDAIGVHPGFQRRHVGAALVDQLRTNLLGLGIATLRTEVGWDNLAMIEFLHHERFAPAPRLCLDLDLERTRL
jgi:ribosomal protein S18 acetylase RimI-like enzyme